MLKLKNHLNDCFLSLPFTHLFCNLVIRKRNRRTFPHTWTHTPLTLISFRSAIGREAQVLTSRHHLWLISDSDSIRMPRWISQLESEFLLFLLFPSPFTFITLSRRIISTGPPLLIFLFLYFIRETIPRFFNGTLPWELIPFKSRWTSTKAAAICRKSQRAAGTHKSWTWIE